MIRLAAVYLILLVAAVASAAPPFIGYVSGGTDVKLVKPNVDLNGQSKILSGTVDPSSSATTAPIGSVYLNSSTGNLYRKLDAGSTTNWQSINYGVAGIVTDPVAYTPTFTGWGTVTNVNIKSWRVGSYLFIDGFFTAGTTTATEARMSLGYNGTDGNVTSASGLPTISKAGEMTGGTPNSTYFAENSVLIEPSVTYVTFGEYGSSTNGLVKQLGSAYFGAVNYSFNIKVPIQGWSTPQVINPSVSPAYAGKQWLGAVQGSMSVGASAAPNNARTTLSAASNATYTLIGSASNDSSTNLQVTATLPAGEYEVNYAGYMAAITAAGAVSTTSCVYELYDGTNVLGTNYLNSNTQAAIAEADSHSLRGYFKLSGTTTKTISVRAAKTSGTSSANSYCLALIDAASGDASSAMLTITPRSQSIPMPVIANSVITSNAGVETVNRATITNNGSACAILSQSGTWASAPTRNGAGRCSITISGFSATPTCTCAPQVAGAGGCVIDNSLAFNSTNVGFRSAAGGVETDATTNVICMGPK